MNVRQKAIESFISWCTINYKKRKCAVECQFTRDVWEAESSIGLIRISKYPKPKMVLYCSVHLCKLMPKLDAVQEFNDLTVEEYEKMEKVFFGDFYPNILYLVKIGSVKGLKNIFDLLVKQIKRGLKLLINSEGSELHQR